MYVKMTGEESREFFLRIAFAPSLNKQLSQMLCNNQRTCSTVGKKERQLEGYGFKRNLNCP